MAHLSTEFGRADAVMLDEITEDAFTGNLKLRYDKDKIYTYIGEVLISMNPYKALPIYDEDLVSEYHGTAMYQREPHVFALAEAAYAGMRREKADCCILISGESGSGKTEASKHIMRYIAAVSVPSKREEVDRVKDMLLASNPLLEAFGNAKTARNDNSSRFGKYMDINFDYKFEPVGGHVNNYLLEKARVIKHAETDRNFHIFYQLLAGADDALLSSLDLERDAGKYRLLNQGKVQALDSDKADYGDLQAAADSIGFSADTKDMLFKLVATVLHLGQVEFEADGEASKVANGGSIGSIGKLIGTDAATLEKALTNRVIAARGEIFESKLNAEKASQARDALSKAVYNELFTYLVSQINSSISVAEGSKGTVIGVLDIYGFEIFPENGFEQFCINYCNEKLQQLFIELVMKREQEEYAREGIDWVEVAFFDNKGICEMVEENNGIIAILDDHANRPDGGDAACLSHLTQTLNANDRFSSFSKDAQSGCKRDQDFKIKHFAGDVVYTINGFVEKNNDTLFQDLKRMLYQCKMTALQTMFPEGADALDKVHKNPATAATNFKSSMLDLVSLLEKKNPYYVRCIKPNGNKSANDYDADLCSHQVRYLGLMENLRVRRAGYCNRQTYDVFVDRYKMLTKETWPHYRGDQKEGARIIIAALKLTDNVAFGKTKIFIKEPSTLYFIEEKREEAIPLLVAKIQAFYRGMLARRFVKKLRAQLKISRWWRSFKAVKYMTAITGAFKFPADDMCKATQWPSPPTGISAALETLGKRLHTMWWTKAVLKKFSAEKKAEIETKMLAYTLLKGKRAQWGCGLEWKGNYMAANPNAEKYGAAVLALITKHQDGKAVFASEVLLLNMKKKEEAKILVVTEKNIYVLDAKKFKMATKVPYGLDTVTELAVSTGEDQLTVIKIPGGTDLVVKLVGDAVSAELVTAVINGCGKTLPVKVADSLSVTLKGGETTLTLEEEDSKATKFTASKEGVTLVNRKQSIIRQQERRGAEPAAP